MVPPLESVTVSQDGELLGYEGSGSINYYGNGKHRKGKISNLYGKSVNYYGNGKHRKGKVSSIGGYNIYYYGNGKHRKGKISSVKGDDDFDLKVGRF